MKRKIVSAIAAMSLILSGALAKAEERVPKVVVNGFEINCAEQDPVIINNSTMIPARYVFEALGCSVRWSDSKNQVVIDSSNHVTRIVIPIDSDTIKVATFTSILSSTVEEVKLLSPACILNNRTLIPLRAVGEALGAEVNWNPDTYTATVDMPDDKEKVLMSLVGESRDVSAGETVSVYVNVSGMSMYPGVGNVGLKANIKYDTTEFEYVGGSILASGDREVAGISNADPYYGENLLRVSYERKPEIKITGDSQNFAVLKFKALTDNGGALSISKTYGNFGYEDISVSFANIIEGKSENQVIGQNPGTLNINSTPVVFR